MTKKHPRKRLVRRDAFPDPLDETAARLALIAPPVTPPPALKQRLLARINASKGGAGSSGRPELEERVLAGRLGEPAPPWRFGDLRAGAGWVRLPFPGVRMREVTIDRERDTALLYVEMEPGAVFPDHDHSSPERGLVLTGDFETGGRVLRAGEFYEAAAGTRHERIASPSGCTGLLWVGAKAWAQWRAALAAAGGD